MRKKHSSDDTVIDFVNKHTSGYTVLATLSEMNFHPSEILTQIEPLDETFPEHVSKLVIWTSSVLARLTPKGNPDLSAEVVYDYKFLLNALISEALNKGKTTVPLKSQNIYKSSYKAEDFEQMLIALTRKPITIYYNFIHQF